MNEKLIEYLEKLEGSVEKVVEFSSEQVPLVIQEMINWEVFFSSFWLVFFGFIIIMMIATVKKFDKLTANMSEEVAIPICVFYVIFFVISCILFVVNFFDLVYVYLCPRLFVLNELKKLLQ